ncbi:uncharacterized protein SCHCODRAFT_02582059 [Schizophyllum commune H4-8]|uniref:uncharacterized protein n=1 Tax=Schizophyllum commune (strain H4-8 / FGSC 9210) TaxID=578458 RepID=UPI00215FB0EB|nr:uncharacterized protein SCHCODRAFT_02582059 [Schizophyllum commune H4-8]KAI5891860.1 hypothetical protein SCHCODRAFT_02582059 [Schizophyllum commune H4-8]
MDRKDYFKRTNPPGHDPSLEYEEMLKLGVLARQLTGEMTFIPGYTRKGVAAEIRDQVRTAFRTLITESSSFPETFSDSFVDIIFTSLRLFLDLWHAVESTRDNALAAEARTLWPHIVRWSAALNPARNDVVTRYPHRDATRQAGDIANAYLTILESSMETEESARDFLYTYPDVITQAYELWRYLPQIYTLHIKPFAPPEEVSGAAIKPILLARRIYHTLVNAPDGDAVVGRELLSRGIDRAMKRQDLYRAIAPLTQNLRQLKIDPDIVPNVWFTHLILLDGLAALPELAPSVVPRSAFCAVISVGMKAFQNHELEWDEIGLWAVRLVDSLCHSTCDNRSFVRAIREGYLGLLIDLEKSTGKRWDHPDFVRRLCSAAAQGRVLRALRSTHNDFPHTASFATRKPVWRKVAQVFQNYDRLYTVDHRERIWRRHSDCSNAMVSWAPITRSSAFVRAATLCIAPEAANACTSRATINGTVARNKDPGICVVSCGVYYFKILQLTAWEGAFSLNDIAFLIDIVHADIWLMKLESAFPEAFNIFRKRASSKRRSSEQVYLIVDFSDALDMRYETKTRSVDSAMEAYTVPVQVVFRLGATLGSHFLPFTYSFNYFLTTEYDELCRLRLLARQSAGEVAFSPGGTAKSVLADLRAKVPTTFRTLSSATPPSLSATGDYLVQVIFLSLRVSTHIWRAVEYSKDRSLERATRCLWPHIVRWVAFLHPARNNVIARYPQRDAAREAFDIAQAYLVVLEEMLRPFDVTKNFLHSNPDLITQAVELWRYLPRIHAFYPRSSSASAYVQRAFCRTIWLAMTLFKVLASSINAATSKDRALFCECVNIAIPRRQTLYRLIAPLTHCVAQLDMDPNTTLNMWRSHLAFLVGMAELPELAPSRIPRSAFKFVIHAGKRCLRLHDTRHGGYWAIRLVDVLCRSTGDNQPFLHALEEGYLELLIDFEKYTGVEYNHTDFVRNLCTTMIQARAIRIIRRLHPDLGPLPVAPMKIVTWRLAAFAHRNYQSLYETKYGNICPCGDVVYCSGSCQRMHWKLVHRTQCRRDSGPWGLHGTFSLNDVTFLFDLVLEGTLLLKKNPEVCEKLAAFDKKRRAGGRKFMQQICLVTDYTDVLAPRIELEAQTASSLADTQRVFVEIAFRSGKATLRRRLPITYPFEYFLS